MFAWTRKFYAEKDGVYYNFDRKRNRDDAVLNHGFANRKLGIRFVRVEEQEWNNDKFRKTQERDQIW